MIMMFAELPIAFERPVWLFVLLLIIPSFLFALRSIGGMSRGKAITTFAFRCLVIVLLAAALAHPSWVKKGEGVTVTIILDRSQSIPLPLKEEAVRFLRKASLVRDSREPDDRVAVVTVAREANIAAMPDVYSEVSAGQDVTDPTATNLASGVRIALAIMPDDTANRLLIASDGNETVDSVAEAAEIAKANKVPIDVLLLEYEYDNEVIFDRIRAPARARVGQTSTITMSLRSQRPTTGTIYLKMDGTVLDLNGTDDGDGMRVSLESGRNVYQLEISLDQSGATQFEATFEPDDPSADYIDRNNNAYAVTFVGGEGKVLVIDDGVSESQYLMQALRDSNIEVQRIGPGGLVNLVYLTSFDAVILCNIPRYSFDDAQDNMLHAYVHDLGGGLIMLGGPQSFGAGGWIDSETAKVLPVKLDPPSSRQLPRGALALIMHSCEMPQGNFWAQKVAEAAINSLSRLDYVGIVEFGGWGGGGGGGFAGSSWAFPMQLVGDRKAALAATKKMAMGDMPDFQSSMQVAHAGLTTIRAGQKHAIIISDGDPSPPTPKLLGQYVSAKITVTTVMVGGHGTLIDRSHMQAVANKTGGNFYNVTNPKKLPEIFMKEAQLVSRSLIQEGEIFQPQVASRLPGPTDGFTAVPEIDGYVLTAAREGLTQNAFVIATKEGVDPLYASWNYGLGRSIAYTSDITGRWGGRWPSWGEFRTFWEQSVRWVMRPTGERNVSITTHQDGDIAVVEVEALDDDAQSLNFLNAGAQVHRPSGETEPVLLQQVGPGRYRMQFVTDEAGAYIVDVSYRTGDQERASHLQAAVAVPYSDEFKSVKHNAALLRQLAEDTGGRMLAANDPEVADLFKRDDLTIPKSPKRIWDLLTILAAALFLFDVAARRLTIDPAKIRAMAGRAVGSRADASTDAVAAWKRTRSQMSQRTGAAQTAAQKRRDRAAAEADRSRKYEVEEGDAEISFDVSQEATAGPRKADDQTPKRRDSHTGQAADEDEGDYTSRLLRAKRRARGEENDGGGDAR